MSQSVNIYCIKSPINDEIVYIGKTILPLEVRLYQHINDTSNAGKIKWLSDIISMGLQPAIELIEHCAQDQADIIEKKWIRHYSISNPNLLNIVNKKSAPENKQRLEYQKIGNRLKELRVAAGYTAALDFAYEHEIHPAQYARYEAGSDLKISSLVRVLSFHNLTLQQFFAGIE